jgi:hypothetical protein
MREAVIKRIFDLGALEEALGRSPGRRGRKPLREILADAVIETHSREELEFRFRQLCHEARLPPPVMNTAVEGYLVDAVWTDAEPIVELDSSRKSLQRSSSGCASS